jgi:hypothetical protein
MSEDEGCAPTAQMLILFSTFSGEKFRKLQIQMIDDTLSQTPILSLVSNLFLSPGCPHALLKPFVAPNAQRISGTESEIEVAA